MMHLCFAKASPPLRNLKDFSFTGLWVRTAASTATSFTRGAEELYEGKLSRAVLRWRLHLA